jgi:hypothetical protein
MNDERDIPKRASTSREGTNNTDDILSIDLVLSEITSILSTIEGYAKYAQTQLVSSVPSRESPGGKNGAQGDGSEVEVFSKELDGVLQMSAMDYVALEEVISVCVCVCIYMCM